VGDGQTCDFKKTDIFEAWLEGIDSTPRGRIIRRIKKAECGNFGDCETIEGGVIEIKLHFGPGYRLYCYRTGADQYLLLTGGDKSTQAGDAACARAIKKELEGSGKW